MSEAQSCEVSEFSLGKLAKGYRGVSYRPEQLKESADDSTATLLRATNIQNGSLDFDDVQFVPKSIVSTVQVLREGDLAVCMSNGSKALVGKSASFHGNQAGNFTAGAFCSIFRPTDPDARDLVIHLFHSQAYQRAIDIALSGSAINNLKNSDIEAVSLCLPPRATWQRIAAILTSLDNAIEATEALIEKHTQIRTGLMHDLFTRGALLNGRRRKSFAEAPDLYQETALGPLPREWRPSTVGESFAIDSGITLGPHRRPVRRSRKYLRVANVHREQLRLDDVASIEALPGDEGYALEEGDLLVVEGHANPAEIGRCAMVNQDAAGMLFQNHLFRLRVNGIDKSFALLWLNSFHVQRYWERTCSTSSGLHTINRRMLKAVPLYVPSEAEQTRIVSAAASARAVLDGHVKMAAKLRAHNRGVMQDLLTGKVRVPLAETASA